MSGVDVSLAECHRNTRKSQIGPSRVKSMSEFKGFSSPMLEQPPYKQNPLNLFWHAAVHGILVGRESYSCVRYTLLELLF